MIGKRLKDLRTDIDMSREQLAEKLDLSVHTISSYEQDKSTPDDLIKVKLAQIFNISLDYLLGATDIAKPLIQTNVIELPKDFPPELIKHATMAIEVLHDSYKYRKHIR